LSPVELLRIHSWMNGEYAITVGCFMLASKIINEAEE
jgi:hypothetical protein